MASLVIQMVKNLPAMQETQVQSLGWEDPLEKGMATPSSTFAWENSWTEDPGGLQSWGQRVRHDWVTNTFSLLLLEDIIKVDWRGTNIICAALTAYSLGTFFLLWYSLIFLCRGKELPSLQLMHLQLHQLWAYLEIAQSPLTLTPCIGNRTLKIYNHSSLKYQSNIDWTPLLSKGLY